MRLPALFISVALLACVPAPAVTTGATPNRGDDRLNDADRARQALNRLTFGARPGDLAMVERIGVNAWIDQQLHPARIADPVADSVLGLLEITNKSALELAADHPQANEIAPAALAMADSMAMRPTASKDSTSAMAQLASLRASAERTNQRAGLSARLAQTRTAANRELPPSILLRAQSSDRQLLEVMTDFWENHFSVSSDAVPFPFLMVDYDHAIRSHALGRFRDLLGAVATTPAMLLYLDNASSGVDSLHPTLYEWQLDQRRLAHPPLGDTSLVHTVHRRRTGLNENYARELMELHTLGVDGGYTQHDVQEVARCLTGWTVDNVLLGGAFVFQPTMHDAGEKVVLGVHIPGGRGIEDGQQVLDILARHPSTAHFIARKLVIHFVSDSPPRALVDRAAQVYMRTDGDIREVLRTVITSPEFNSRTAYRVKIKTPFELVASVLRVMNAVPDTTQQTVQILTQLGQRIFGRATPDGWPDQAVAWMNAGALMNRVNLGTQVGANQVRNITIAAWKPAQGLLTLSADKQVDAVIEAILSADASAETRQAMTSIASPTHSFQHVGDLVAMAIGSSDFQRR